MALSMWTATTSPRVSQACTFWPLAPCSWMICDTLHSNETGLSATRDTLTRLLGAAVSPEILNSLTSWATWAAVAFICCAKSMVARFQTNSPVSWMLATLSFQEVEENPMIGGREFNPVKKLYGARVRLPLASRGGIQPIGRGAMMGLKGSCLRPGPLAGS